MTDPHLIRIPINNPALDRAFTKAMRGKPMPPPGSAVPKTKAEFDAMVAEAERDLRPARIGRPRKGTRGAITRTRSIRAPEDLWARVEALAQTKGITANQATVLALEHLLAE